MHSYIDYIWRPLLCFSSREEGEKERRETWERERDGGKETEGGKGRAGGKKREAVREGGENTHDKMPLSCAAENF